MSTIDQRIVKSTVTDSVIGRLRDEIRAGVLEPGFHLRQGEVAQRFAVSTTPVREAFQALEREGLLVSNPHRGVVVFKPTMSDLVEAYDIRIPLEALAIEKAVPNMTDEYLAQVSLTLAGLHEAQRAALRDPAPYHRLNGEFHRMLYAPAGRPKLAKLIQDLRDESSVYLRFYASNISSPHGVDVDHDEIFDACRAGAPRRAAKAIERHLRRSVEHISAAFELHDHDD